VLRIRAGACRSIVISAQSQHSDSQGDNYSRRAALLATASGAALLAAPHCALAAEQNAYDFSVIQYGKERDLTEFKNEVVVVVNVASE